MNKSIYIAGPMTGIPFYNAPAFKAAAKDLREMGYTVVSPIELDNDRGIEPSPTGEALPEEQYEQLLAEDLDLLRGCDHIALLPGWENSKGARREFKASEEAGMEAVYLVGPDYEYIEDLGYLDEPGPLELCSSTELVEEFMARFPGSVIIRCDKAKTGQTKFDFTYRTMIAAPYYDPDNEASRLILETALMAGQIALEEIGGSVE